MYTALRPSSRLLASHAPRTPMISFPDRSKTPQHSLGPHPCAPASIISSSPFLSNLSSNSNSSSSSQSKPLLGPAGGQATGSGFQSSLPPAQYDESNLPAWLQRSRYAPLEDEVEAVLSGGASISPVVSKQYKEKWYTAQI
ncbi:hypothetical protein BCR35DRAFT_349351 [Leucosporidium creatinivorum]|uniref:Uncharacterized protein n=1 Tax=Leucosporidium creatinivorum TaxID=106004 RepID=A0A1Y2G2E4_9BASI|nr:hypothetical protein BCR35DRAFT_349351 [Leucosporidium creatinivorum]